MKMQHDIKEAVMEKRREHRERDGPNRVRKGDKHETCTKDGKQPQADQAEADHEGRLQDRREVGRTLRASARQDWCWMLIEFHA